MIQVKLKYLGVILLIGALSCKNQSRTHEVELLISEEELSVEADFSDYDLALPPVDLLMDLMGFNLNFSPNEVNSVFISNRYVSQRSKTLNLGIYFADFSYLSAIEKRKNLSRYLENIKSLSDDLKIYGLFNRASLKRFSGNIDNPDSLYYLSIETHKRMINILEESNRYSTLLHISIGGLVESFYLFIKPIETPEQFNEVAFELENYQFMFKEYYNSAKKMIADPFLGETVKDLSTLLEEFESYSTDTVDVKVVKSSPNHISISGGNRASISFEEFLRLKDEISRLRNEFVNLY